MTCRTGKIIYVTATAAHKALHGIATHKGRSDGEGMTCACCGRAIGGYLTALGRRLCAVCWAKP